jgi:hypothetical protein
VRALAFVSTVTVGSTQVALVNGTSFVPDPGYAAMSAC